MTAVLMVCMGNICRSPMAAVVAKAIAKKAFHEPSSPGESAQWPRLHFDSAGTHADHAGQRIDSRANAVLLRHGYGHSEHRSRRVQARDFERYDLLLAMDWANHSELKRHCPPEFAFKVRLFLDFAPGCGGLEVPDPYYGSMQGFERVLELCEAGAEGLINAHRTGVLVPRGIQVDLGTS